MAEAAPISVFIVIIESGCGDDVSTKIGAAYFSELEAADECRRLDQAHWAVDASYTERELPWPAFLQPSRPGFKSGNTGNSYEAAPIKHRRMGMPEPDPEWTCDICGQTFDEGPCPWGPRQPRF